MVAVAGPLTFDQRSFGLSFRYQRGQRLLISSLRVAVALDQILLHSVIWAIGRAIVGSAVWSRVQSIAKKAGVPAAMNPVALAMLVWAILVADGEKPMAVVA